VFLAERPRRTKLLDFGISKFQMERDLELTATGTVVGTPLYVAPEQLRGSKDVTPASDLYALGAILYKGALGQAPDLLGELQRVDLRGAGEGPADCLRADRAERTSAGDSPGAAGGRGETDPVACAGARGDRTPGRGGLAVRARAGRKPACDRAGGRGSPGSDRPDSGPPAPPDAGVSPDASALKPRRTAPPGRIDAGHHTPQKLEKLPIDEANPYG
jgi:hypothetical protein